MQNIAVLAPTLWRTCRVLANRVRLRILGKLFEHPGQTVSAIGARLRLSRPVASRYLRELNARGLIAAQRSGKWVFYRPNADQSVRGAAALLRALKKTFDAEQQPIETIFRQVTAFTHPRRLMIMQALRFHSHTFSSLRTETGLPERALSRHLRKLKNRGYVVISQNRYRCSMPNNALSRILLVLTCYNRSFDRQSGLSSGRSLIS